MPRQTPVLGLSYPDDATLYMDTARELGITSKMQFLLIGPSEAFFAKKFSKPQTDGVMTIGEWSPRQTRWPGARTFSDAYTSKWHEPPDYLDSVINYVACQILEQAVGQVGLDHAKLRDAIAGRHLFHHQGADPLRQPGERRNQGRAAANPGRRARDRLAARHRHGAIPAKGQVGVAHDVLDHALLERRAPAAGHVSEQLLLVGVANGMLYALIGVSLNLIYGTMRLLDVGHGDLVMVGAYVGYCLLTYAHLDPLFGIVVAPVLTGAIRPAAVSRPVRLLAAPDGGQRWCGGGIAAGVLRPVEHRAERCRAGLRRHATRL